MKSVIYQIIVFKDLVLYALKCMKFFPGGQVLFKFECLFKKVFTMKFYVGILSWYFLNTIFVGLT